MSKREYGKVYVKANMWYCGDEVCNCTQPRIEIMGPNPLTAIRSWSFVRLWEGTFRSDGERDMLRAQRVELIDACRLFRIPYVFCPSYFDVGQRLAFSEEIENFNRYVEWHTELVRHSEECGECQL